MSLVDEMVRDAAVAIWPLDDAAAPFASLIVNKPLADLGAGGLTPRGGVVVPGEPTLQFTKLASGANRGIRYSGTPPLTAVDNWTLECYARFADAALANSLLFYMGDSATGGYGLLCAAAGSGASGSFVQPLFGGVAFTGQQFGWSVGVDYQFILKRAAGSTTFWVDGVQVGGAFATAPAAPANFVWAGGASATSTGHGGLLGYCAAYASALSTDRMTAHRVARLRNRVSY